MTGTSEWGWSIRRSTMSAAAEGLPSRPLVFVGGKGGVGKTTVAAALALGAARSGLRTLLVSTDPAHSLGDLFDREIGDQEREITPGLHALEVDPEREVERYLERVKNTMRSFVRPALYPEIERQMELTRHSPGAAEAALMDRMAALMHEGRARYDRIVFDTAPTGHTLRLLALPEMMSAWTDGLLRSRDRSDALGEGVDRLSRRKSEGDELSMIDQVDETPSDERSARIREALLERRRTFTRARRALLDPEVTAFLLVLVPEKLPILETGKALEVLRRHGIPVAGLVVNRVLEKGTGVESSGDIEFLEGRRAQQAEYLARIDREFGDLPHFRLPFFARDVEGLSGVEGVAELLFRE